MSSKRNYKWDDACGAEHAINAKSCVNEKVTNNSETLDEDKHKQVSSLGMIYEKMEGMIDRKAGSCIAIKRLKVLRLKG
ncbi:hypothetical protein Bhyg_17917 [Pseudolycoriella hygida]|uniref:Uncharacterized protein n=1 Tax=Pseudolycoriella hygida TaxID=35572 RepID=A0A9Q0MI18_9DIPT|nr:hypothetical protein Bhyg_18016 [Pseudolycoriella hygida]KAJ6617793.1 hypothetical protein Bhyg_17917 [Pseudolycoriella hygida]